jgi:membrane-associated phospholipid phosphatase
MTTALLSATATPALAAQGRHPSSPPATAASASSVLDWNRELMTIVATPGLQPATLHPTRSFALLQAAEYDAVVSVTKVGKPYQFEVPAPRDARADVAADQAAHDVLTALYPSVAADLDQLLATQLSSVAKGSPRTGAVRVGAAVARLLVHDRAFDGSAATPPPFVAGTAAGDYQPTPPAFPAPVFTGWGAVTPWLLTSGSQFRSAAPPPVSSTAYAQALLQVKSLGQDSSTTRTADETTEAKFWGSAPIWNTWNAVADNLLTQQRADLGRAVAVLADLDLTLADTAIALYDTKYAYAVWRPVTAVRAGNTGYNPGITFDPAAPGWSPLANTAPDPSFVGAHSAFSEAAAKALTRFYGPHQHVVITSPAMPAVSRTFGNLQAAATEAGLSRIFAGQHTLIDHVAGQHLGAQVAAFALHRLGPVVAGQR